MPSSITKNPDESSSSASTSNLYAVLDRNATQKKIVEDSSAHPGNPFNLKDNLVKTYFS